MKLRLLGLFSLNTLLLLAILFPVRHGQAITLKSATSSQNNISNTLSISAPTGITPGDVMLASLAVENQPSITAPTGWTLIRKDINPAALHLVMADYYHVATASEPTSYTWTFSAAHGASGGIVDYSGVDNLNPIDANSGQTGNGSTPILAPSVTTTVANDQLVAVFGNGVNRTYTGPAGMTLQYSNSTTTSGEKTDILVYDQPLTAAGPTGNRSVTPSGNWVGGGQLIALKAASTITQVNNPPIVDSVVINQTSPATNDTLSATVQAHDPDGNPITLSYQWLLNGFNIPGATSPTLDLSQSGNGNKGDMVSLTVVASDGSLQSQPVTSGSVTIVNTPPSATVSLDNTTPDKNSFITATAVDTDVDNDSVTNTFVWKVNSNTIQSLTTTGNQATINLGLISGLNYGDSVTVELTPSDGTASGATVLASAIVTQPLGPPTITSVVITPSSPQTNNTLVTQVTASDPGGKNLTYTYQWVKNGIDIPGATNSSLDLSQSGNGDKGDSIAVRVIANDGQSSSQSYTSTAVTVINTPPVISAVNLTPAQPTPTSTLTVNAVASDADGDPISYSYAWSINGNVVQTDTTSATSDSYNLSGHANAGDTVKVMVTPNDGTANGVLFTSSATVQSASTFGQVTEYQIPGAAIPANLVSGPDGNIWFDEESQGSIGTIDINTGAMTMFPVLPTGSAMGAMSVGSDGRIWISQGSLNKVGAYNISTGVYTQYPLSSGATPAGNALGPDGNLWVSEYGISKIARITPTGVVTEFATPTGSAHPHGMAKGPDGNMWFTEYSANKIARITPSGVITEYSLPTASAGAIVITAGPDGNLWFTEQLANKIGRISPSGVITEFATSTSAMPVGIAAGPDGNLWFCENKANKIASITTSGVITEYAIPSASVGANRIVAGSDGNLWFTEHTTGRMARFALH